MDRVMDKVMVLVMGNFRVMVMVKVKFMVKFME
jgi:hypothetical protein